MYYYLTNKLIPLHCKINTINKNSKDNGDHSLPLSYVKMWDLKTCAMFPYDHPFILVKIKDEVIEVVYVFTFILRISDLKESNLCLSWKIYVTCPSTPYIVHIVNVLHWNVVCFSENELLMYKASVFESL